MKTDFDLALIGSGFSGSLLSMIARQLGLSVALIERDRHPRFVIGESTTPLTNLLWEQITAYYGLDELTPLAKWGSWQECYPKIGAGLKRGFTFYSHAPPQRWAPNPDHTNELMVAASSAEARADTHWYRPDFDAFLVEAAQQRNVEYLDRTEIHELSFAGDSVRLGAHRQGRGLNLRVRFVLDASGPRGCLFRQLTLPEAPRTRLPITEGLYGHFHGVRRWDQLFSSDEKPPYPADDAALHHVFDGGWIWVLRFNNGLTSAGAALRTELAQELGLTEGDAAWHRLLDRFPSIRDQFAEATGAFPMIHADPLSFRSGVTTGDRWTLLPSAAGFLDPLLSTGFPLTLIGIGRLAKLLEEDWGKPRFDRHLARYGDVTARELDRVEVLLAALYGAMPDFEVFTRLTLLYFAAAAFAETAYRLRRPELAGELFLLGNHPTFGPGLNEVCAQADALYAAGSPAPADRQDLLGAIDRALEPVDLGGLRRPDRPNWHPLDNEELVASAHKLGVDPSELERLLR